MSFTGSFVRWVVLAGETSLSIESLGFFFRVNEFEIGTPRQLTSTYRQHLKRIIGYLATMRRYRLVASAPL